MAATLTRISTNTDGMALLAFLIVGEACGLLGLTVTYGELHELRSYPTGAVGGVGGGLVMQLVSVLAWIVMHGLVAFAGWSTWQAKRTPERRSALTWFAFQLVLPIAWSFVCFGRCQPGLAIVILAAALVAMIITAVKVARVAGATAFLFAPIVIATAYALIVNVSVWRMGVVPG